MKHLTSNLHQNRHLLYCLLCAVLFSSCSKGIFVWTLKDIGGLVSIGVLLLFGLIYLIAIVIDKLQTWWRGLFKK